jgi:hypothetical protein
MLEKSPPPGWSLQPKNWPYWMPSALWNTLPPSALPKNPWEPAPVVSARSVAPPNTNGGLFASLTRSIDPWDRGAVDRSQSAPPPGTNGGLLGILAHDPWTRSATDWSQSAGPFVAGGGHLEQSSPTSQLLSTSYRARTCDQAYDQCARVNPVSRGRLCYESWKTCNSHPGVPIMFPGGV